MRTTVYELYVSTFERARAAVAASDDARLQQLCAEVAARDGLESAASLLAMTDVERLTVPRRRTAMLWLVRNARG